MDIDSMKVADLKRELKARNLPCTGTKAELAERLRSSLVGSDDTFGDEALPEEGLSDTDEGLLNEDDLLKDVSQAKSPEKKITPAAAPAAKAAPPPVTVVKTAAVLQKEGVLLPMEDNLFSDPVPPPETASASSNDPSKLKARAARFGLPEAKLEERAKKFGAVKIGDAPEVDKQKLLDRAKRFGIPVGEDGKQAKETPVPKASAIKPSPVAKSAEDLEKLRKRAERFGENVSQAVTKANAQEILEKRKEKFQAAKLERAAKPSVEEPSTEATAPKKRKPIVF
ncbi:SAP domain-containing ribonucleoprotein [Galendromus occidentalis]|uniref:SAP domain-containing ribonucleoprotein n=1 Tax=Galendromus occidentalis TaxID=34638 RepID=A0AAJ6QS46_9ACAR|nr:SAP domain-containing ribonucleoprotein [Galendromus occidentalis]